MLNFSAREYGKNLRICVLWYRQVQYFMEKRLPQVEAKWKRRVRTFLHFEEEFHHWWTNASGRATLHSGGFDAKLVTRFD